MSRRAPAPDFDELPDRVTTFAARLSSLLPEATRIPGGRPDRPTDDPDSVALEERERSEAECVHRIIERKGGRVYQTDIVEATDWSKAKVSRILAEMEQHEAVDRLRLGRQKVVCYPQYLPEWAEDDSRE